MVEAERLEKSWWLDVNERRAAVGLEPVDGGDVVLVPNGWVPLDAVGMDPAPPPEASPKKAVESPTHTKRVERLEKVRDKVEERTLRVLRDRFEGERRAVMVAIDGAEDIEAAALAEVDAGVEAWNTAYTQIYLDAAKQAGRDNVQHELAACPELLTKDVAESTWLQRVRERLAKVGAERVQLVLETTKADIARIVAAGIADGLPIFDIAKQIDTLYLEQIIPNRSEVIARTESSTAMNTARVETVNAYEIPYHKEWSAYNDSRSRPDHAGMNTETVAQNDTFSNGLEYPGDPSGDPGEVINCRCDVLTIPLES
jgi:uncharacterized protein with gpF-like domain